MTKWLAACQPEVQVIIFFSSQAAGDVAAPSLKWRGGWVGEQKGRGGVAMPKRTGLHSGCSAGALLPLFTDMVHGGLSMHGPAGCQPSPVQKQGP
eukprot:364534-Chlamydomonas_euryale.AAC.5